jgi:hypothetical protein
MMATATALPSFALFPPTWEQGKDFVRGLTFGTGGKDSVNRMRRYRDAATVKPILNVSGIGSPFKVIESAVASILILMVNDRKTKRIWHKGHSNKSVNQDSAHGSFIGQFNFGVLRSRGTNENSRPDVAALYAADVPAKAFDSPEIADFVKTFVSGDWKPSFIRQGFNIIGNGWFCVREKVFNLCFNVEFARRLFGASPQVDHQVPIVRGGVDYLCADKSPSALGTMPCNPRNPSHAVQVGDFIQTFKARNGKPFLALSVQNTSLFGEKSLDEFGDCHVFGGPVAAQANTAVVDFEDFGRPLAAYLAANFNPLHASDSAEIGGLVSSLKSRNRDPLLVLDAHNLSDVCQELSNKQHTNMPMGNALSSNEFISNNKEI